jgi:hypothetical protein
VAFPDFSEFSYGYAVVRQIEMILGGQTVVPTFPTQPQEADGGYDVSFLSHGVPLFIQFKRSEVMRYKSCREYKDKNASLQFPIFRMHLHSKHDFKQHFLMQNLESKGNIAIYCSSSVPDKNSLDRYYASGNIFDASAIFRPLEIVLPSLNEEHHVSFCTTSDKAWVYSKEGVAFERSTSGLHGLLSQLRQRARVSLEHETELLSEVADDFERLGGDRMAERQREKYIFQPSDMPQESDVMGSSGLTELVELENAREVRRARIREIKSVVKRAALHAFFEADAMLVSVSRETLTK